MSVSVMLADDHPIIRFGLRSLLQSEPDFDVIGEANDGLSAIEMMERCNPDVAIVDLMMPDMNGLEVLRQSRRFASKTRVIVLSMHSDHAYVLEALRSGAMGYVLKDACSADLIQAIHEVVAGERYLSATISKHILEAYIQRGRDASRDPYETLTAREREVLQLAAQGRSNPQIAVTLAISPRTVEIHRANMMHKLGLHHQTELVRYALRREILPPE